MEVAVMVAVPAPTPVTTPLWLTEAIPELLVVQVTPVEIPASALTDAFRFAEDPMLSVTLLGDTETEFTALGGPDGQTPTQPPPQAPIAIGAKTASAYLAFLF